MNDAAALAMMARLIVLAATRGEQPSERDAAREVVRALALRSGHVTPGAVEDRLRGKFRRHRAALLSAAGFELIPNYSQAPPAT